MFDRDMFTEHDEALGQPVAGILDQRRSYVAHARGMTTLTSGLAFVKAFPPTTPENSIQPQ